MSEELAGPKKSREAIEMLEDWLRKNCKKPMPVYKIKAAWQYLTGHEPRKIVQYLAAIESGCKIKLFSNDGKKYCIWIGEQSETPFMDSVKQEKLRKLAEIIDAKMEEEADRHGKKVRFC